MSSSCVRAVASAHVVCTGNRGVKCSEPPCPDFAAARRRYGLKAFRMTEEKAEATRVLAANQVWVCECEEPGSACVRHPSALRLAPNVMSLFSPPKSQCIVAMRRQGVYNGFLAAGLFWSMGATSDVVAFQVGRACFCVRCGGVTLRPLT